MALSIKKEWLLAALFLCTALPALAQNEKLNKVLQIRKEIGQLEKEYRQQERQGSLDAIQQKSTEALRLLNEVAQEDRRNGAYARMSIPYFYHSALNSMYRLGSYSKILEYASTGAPVALNQLPEPDGLKKEEEYEGDVMARQDYRTYYYRSHYLAAMAAAMSEGKENEQVAYSNIALAAESNLDAADAMQLRKEIFMQYYNKNNYEAAMNTYKKMVNEMADNIFLRNNEKLKRDLLHIDTLVNRTGGISYEENDKGGTILQKVAHFYGELAMHEAAYNKTGQAIQNGAQNDDAYSYRLEMALKLDDKEKIRDAADAILANKDKLQLTSYDYDRLGLAYDRIGDATKASLMRETAKNTKAKVKKGAVTQVNMYVGIFPVDYFFDVYPLSVAIGTTKFSHELRGELYRQSNGFTFPLKNNNRTDIRYDGYQLAYILRKRIGSLPLYVGAQANYTSLQFNATNINLFDNTSGAMVMQQTVEPEENRYGLTAMLGANFKIFWRMYLDAYIGYGYNFTNYEPGFNSGSFNTDNSNIKMRINRTGLWLPYSGFRVWVRLF